MATWGKKAAFRRKAASAVWEEQADWYDYARERRCSPSACKRAASGDLDSLSGMEKH